MDATIPPRDGFVITQNGTKIGNVIKSLDEANAKADKLRLKLMESKEQVTIKVVPFILG